jgi:hypothetical protein
MELLEAAAQEECTYQSELIRDAVLFYMAENPAGIHAFADVSHPARRRTSSEPSIEQAEVDVEQADLEADEAAGVVPYDPTEEF